MMKYLLSTYTCFYQLPVLLNGEGGREVDCLFGVVSISFTASHLASNA